MFWLIKQIFFGLFCFSRSLASIANTPGHTKCISLINQCCLCEHTPLNLHRSEYI